MKMNIIQLAVIVVTLHACKKHNETTGPTVAPIREAVFASGSIKPVNEIILTAMSEGYVEEIVVEENDIISKNDVVCIIRNAQSRINEESARKILQLAKANLHDDSPVFKPLHAELKVALQNLVNDSIQYMRMMTLYNTKSVSKHDFEVALVNYENAKAKAVASREHIDATKNVLTQELIAAEQQHELALSSSGNYRITSPQNSKVFQVFKRQGEYVRKGEAVALLGHLDSLIAELNIDETAIAKISPGQKVLIGLNTHPDQLFEGKVENISPYFQENTQAYKITVSTDSLPDNIIAGTLLQANIIVGTKAKALLIPKEYLSPDMKVIRMNEGKPDTVSVKTGIISDEWVEIREGLRVDDQIIKFR